MAGRKHISKQFDADLKTVRMSVLKMGGIVEEQIDHAVKALTTADQDLMEQVVADDYRVNEMEVSIDEICSQIIARRQPAAGDLRMIIMVIKIITDLERIGDEAAKIARMAQLIYADDRIHKPRFHEIRHVANIAMEMLRKSLDAFARLDVTEAAHVARQDELVDDEFRSILRQLVTFMMEDPRNISSSIEILFAAKAIERIGDHAKNMSQYVIFLIKGKDVRHVGIKEIERVARKQ
ncbi:MAG: phosphate transport system regulatory protein PhoU [Nitrosomonadaceae bacterium]|nr:phosphate transport system regulatory protein PhoU [Nitrosomonadaceae bacterium]|tara:strand:- start:2267 stop:2977 length:711 start_codon:yes stop_codon:yes gene_type:complete